MIDQLSTVTSATVSVALDALSQRQQLIAANLASPNGATQAATEIDFESALARALESGSDPADAHESLQRLREELTAGHFTRTTDNTIQPDVELVRLNDTVIRYQALIQALGKYGSLTRMAIAGEIK